jgi:nucleoside-triphosphatase THEP1
VNFDRLKNREDVRVVEMTPDNRDRLAGEIIAWIDSRFGSGTA